MPIYDRLSKMYDLRTKEDGQCEFNGYLEDYIHYVEEGHVLFPYKEQLEEILESNPNLKIMINLGLNVNMDVVSNRVIRYKDAFKLPKLSIKIPIMIYGHNINNEQRALLITIGDEKEYLISKALYLCLTEPQKDVLDDRNEILAVTISENTNQLMQSFKTVFESNEKVGHTQRKLENEFYQNIDKFHETIFEYAKELLETLKQDLEKDGNEKQIYSYVSKIYLLKKIIYVQYMMNKNLLNTIHEHDVKKQRTRAKELSDQVSFTPLGQLFKLI